jgi:hypothetical protein
MDGVVTKDQDAAGRELSAAQRLETVWSSAEERVVLLAAVNPDNCPHAMVVRVQGHSWGPRNMQHRSIWGILQSGDTATFDGSESALESGTIGDQLPQDIAHGQDRCVLSQRFLAPCDDILYRQSHELRLRPFRRPANWDPVQSCFAPLLLG